MNEKDALERRKFLKSVAVTMASAAAPSTASAGQMESNVKMSYPFSSVKVLKHETMELENGKEERISMEFLDKAGARQVIDGLTRTTQNLGVYTMRTQTFASIADTKPSSVTTRTILSDKKKLEDGSVEVFVSVIDEEGAHPRRRVVVKPTEASDYASLPDQELVETILKSKGLL